MKLQKIATGARAFSLPPFLEKAWDRSCEDHYRDSYTILRFCDIISLFSYGLH